MKILLIGNSYTYYNGCGEILSRLLSLSKHDNLIVRATKGGKDAHQLLTEKLSYKIWENGKTKKSGTKYLKDILNYYTYDFIVLQNNTTVELTKKYDIEAFNFCSKSVINPNNFIINVTHFGKSLTKERLEKHKEAAEKIGCSIVDTRQAFSVYSDFFSGHKWVDDLTIDDKNFHASARGMYLTALVLFAAICGSNLFSINEKIAGIPLFNEEGGSAKSFITDNFHSGNRYGNSVTETDAARLQFLVRSLKIKKISNEITGGKCTMSKYFGVDVSEHNGRINWNELSKKVDFAILRIGWVGNNQNKLDRKFKENYVAAKRAGVKLGAYVYMYSKSTKAAVSGAKWILKQISGLNFDMPIYCDMEDPTLQGYSKTALSAIASAFCDTIKEAGRPVGVYSSRYWFDNKLNKGLRSKYHTWIAHYTSGVDKYKGEYEMWQNSSKGKIAGVSGHVDTNYLYVDIFNKPVVRPVKPGDPAKKPAELPTYKVGHKYKLVGNLNVRKGPGTDFEILRRNELTKDGYAHSIATNSAVLSSGTVVTCKEIKTKTNEVWLRIPSGWVCAYYKGKKYIV